MAENMWQHPALWTENQQFGGLDLKDYSSIFFLAESSSVPCSENQPASPELSDRPFPPACLGFPLPWGPLCQSLLLKDSSPCLYFAWGY